MALQKRKTRMYEPYGYDDNTTYISKKDQIEKELQVSRNNDCKEFASVEYNSSIQAFVFKNVKGVERGYAYMADIIPQDLIEDAVYDSETKNLIITFVNGKVVNIPLNDLIDITEAGDGLKLEDDKFYINLAENCERFLTVDENGLLLSGVQDAINVERDRAISAETEEYERAVQAESDLDAAIRQEASDRSSGDRLIRTIIGTGFSTNETETVSYKFNDLNQKLTDEISNRQTAIADEKRDRENADVLLETKFLGDIATEKERAENEESILRGLVNSKAEKTSVYTKQETDSKLNGKVDKQLTSSVGKATIFNESDGGGAMFERNNGILSFVGVNDGDSNDVCVQIYSKNKTTNVGSRLNVNPNGIYYKPNSNQQPTVDDEIATKADINALLQEIQTLKDRITALGG